jgi:DNA-binding NtrC family response regulator
MEEQRRKILIVDDEPSIRNSLKLILQSQFEVSTARDGEEAIGLAERDRPDIVLLDMTLPKMDGLEVMKRLKERAAGVPVIMLTAASSVRTAVHAIKSGADDFVDKPFDIPELQRVIASLLDKQGGAGPETGPKSRAGDFGCLVGKSPPMREVFQMIEQIAGRETTVLITGESGTGKELVAMELHNRSSRRHGPFVALNCAAFPESLIESELFGHEKGAFTHAVERRLGQFEVADGGTLFLDEIGELSLAVQVKLLRFLQEQEFYRVGRSKPTRVNVRVITATNRNLEEMVKAKAFRQDLFYRINVINIGLPPLRDRGDDILELANFFVRSLKSRYVGRELSFSGGVQQRLKEYGWPGNVRELENVVESMLALSPSDVVELENLPSRMRERESSAPAGSQGVNTGLAYEEAERLFETEIILRALTKANFVQTRAAQLLGISRRMLKYKMDKLNIGDKGEVLGPGSKHEN